MKPANNTGCTEVSFTARCCRLASKNITLNPLLSPLEGGGGGYLFQTHLRGEGSLIEAGGKFEKGGLFNLANTMVSVLHKELEYKVENLYSNKTLEVMQPRIKNKSELPLVN